MSAERPPLTEDPKSVSFRCFKAKQPVGEFYVGVMPWKTLTEIAFFDVRRRLQELRDVERYLGIQRPLKDERVRQLNHYVNTFDATFPTSIIIAVDERCAQFDEDVGTMTLSNFAGDEDSDPVLYRQIARVIDGQHRIAGLFGYNGKDFDLNITLFVGADIADQAYIFSTVNLEQTKVSKSLAFDLFSLARSRSPQKTCHQVALALDGREDSPFYHKIKRLGVVTPGRSGETLTQAQVVENVMRYVSMEPRQDRDILLRGKSLPKPTAEQVERLPLRSFFVEERDLDIAEILFNYFSAVRDRWPEAWKSRERGAMLARTNGFRALMRLFPIVYKKVGGAPSIPSQERFTAVFSGIKVSDTYFHTDNFPPGTSGEAELYRTILQGI